jgi:hypothetical protein
LREVEDLTFSSNRLTTDSTNSANEIFHDINKWFTTNPVSIYSDKIYIYIYIYIYMQFVTKTSSLIDLHIMYKNKEIANTSNTKFLGQTFYNTFSWKNHTDAIVPKLCSACFTIRAVKPFLSQESLRLVYFSYFHSIMTYGLVFWGNLYHRNTVFKL